MRYWDASALVPLVIAEPATEQVRSWLSEDPHIVTWTWTLVEITSAVERRARDGTITWGQRSATLDRLGDLAGRWDEVTDALAVRRRALLLLARHALRAADAAQLGAAQLVAEAGASAMAFVCLDSRLSLAAEREGLRALPAPA